jgi:hypothetical protein
MHRCRLGAEGILDAGQKSDQSAEGRLRAVAARFAQNAMRLELPYLGPGSVDLPDVPLEMEFAYA